MIAATFINSKSFSVTGNQTVEFHAGRRVKLIGDSTWYGTIESVTYLGNTSIVLTDASDAIDSTLTEVYYGIVSGLEEESSMPVHTHDGDEGSGGAVDHTNLTNKGTNNHLEIDTHITDTNTSITTLSGSIDSNTASISTISGTVDNNTTAIGLNTTHRETTSGNPHQVTKSDVGLGNVPNTDFTSQVNSNTSSISTISGTVDGHTTKLNTIENGAEANNISDANATDLTDGGDSNLHYHSADRDRANHTGTQTASTISDFDTEVSNNTDVVANTAKISYTDATLVASHTNSIASISGTVDSNTSNITTLSGSVDLNTTHRTTTTGNPHQVSTSEVTEDTDYRFVSDAQLAVITNTSGTNTGDQESSDFDHNSLINTHNLTTDIDHNQLTNYSLDQHRVIDDDSVNSTDLLSAQKITNDYKKYAGFENRTDSSIAMNGNNFEITTATSYNVYIKGAGKRTISSTLSIEITEDQNITYVYFDWDGSAFRINKSTSAWDISVGTNIPVAIIFKDGSTYAVTDERHGYNRNLEWHSWAHNNIGALYNSGLAGTFNATTLSVTQGIIYDEDIAFDTGGTKTTTTLWYRNATDGMRIVRNSSTPYSYIGSTMQYDDGSGTLQNVGNNNYCVSWVYASNDSTEPIYTVIGQGNYINLNDAENEASPIINLSTAEWKLLYKVIYRNTATPTYVESQDFRAVQTGVATQSVSPTSHTILTDRDATNQHPATAIQYDDTTTVAEELDNKVDTTDFNSHDNTYHSETYITSSGVTYENLDANGDIGSVAGTVASGNHLHAGTYEPVISKNTAFNKNFGTTSGTVTEGNDSRLSDARTPTSHNNTAHSETYITSAGVTYENLDSNGDVGTTAGTLAIGNHTHSQLHDRSHAITGTSDHTANNWKVLYSNGTGNITELALSTSGTVLTSNGASSAPTFETPESGMTELVEDTSPELGGDLSANGNAIVAADHGTASSPQVVNVVYGTGTAPTASTTTEGTLFIKYTA